MLLIKDTTFTVERCCCVFRKEGSTFNGKQAVAKNHRGSSELAMQMKYCKRNAVLAFSCSLHSPFVAQQLSRALEKTPPLVVPTSPPQGQNPGLVPTPPQAQRLPQCTTPPQHPPQHSSVLIPRPAQSQISALSPPTVPPACRP